MCFTPLLCIWFMPEPKKTPEQAKAQFDKPLFRAYRKFIELMVRMKYLVAAAMIGTIAASFSLLSAVPQQFFPESDRNQYLVYIDLPSGATTEATQKTMTRFTQWLGDTEKNPKVTQSVAYVGYGGPALLRLAGAAGFRLQYRLRAGDGRDRRRRFGHDREDPALLSPATTRRRTPA